MMGPISDVVEKVKDTLTSIPREIGDDNWFALPNWMRKFRDVKTHKQTKACARRVRQMKAGFLKSESCGTVDVAE